MRKTKTVSQAAHQKTKMRVKILAARVFDLEAEMGYLQREMIVLRSFLGRGPEQRETGLEPMATVLIGGE